MKVIIAGMRDYFNYKELLKAIELANYNITEVVSGGAKGVDALGERFAKRQKIPIKQFTPQWSEYGKAAGPRRNTEMAKYADALIAIWDGRSKGTKDMISKALANKLDIYIHRISK